MLRSDEMPWFYEAHAVLAAAWEVWFSPTVTDLFVCSLGVYETRVVVVIPSHSRGEAMGVTLMVKAAIQRTLDEEFGQYHSPKITCTFLPSCAPIAPLGASFVHLLRADLEEFLVTAQKAKPTFGFVREWIEPRRSHGNTCYAPPRWNGANSAESKEIMDKFGGCLPLVRPKPTAPRVRDDDPECQDCRPKWCRIVQCKEQGTRMLSLSSEDHARYP